MFDVDFDRIENTDNSMIRGITENGIFARSPNLNSLYFRLRKYSKCRTSYR